MTTITSDADDYAAALHKKLTAAGLRADLDIRNEKINYKVREHSVAKVPVILVAGRREADEGTISVRRLGTREQSIAPADTVIADLVAEARPPDLRSA